MKPIYNAMYAKKTLKGVFHIANLSYMTVNSQISGKFRWPVGDL